MARRTRRCLSSADSTIITPGDATPILDSNNNIWTIIDGQVVRDGVADPTTANVIALEYKNGVVWQENADQLWWSYGQAADGSSIWTPGTVPVNRSLDRRRRQQRREPGRLVTQRSARPGRRHADDDIGHDEHLTATPWRVAR